MKSRKKKILIYEDDKGISELVTIVLNECGFASDSIDNGFGLLDKVKKFQPDLVLLDLWIPGMNGDEAIKMLKADAKTKDTPIIVMSALNEAGKIAHKNGADGFIAKPFDVDELLKVVRKYTE